MEGLLTGTQPGEVVPWISKAQEGGVGQGLRIGGPQSNLGVSTDMVSIDKPFSSPSW